MLGNHFRPWGEIDWFFRKTSQIDWDILGCISAEDRFIGTLDFLSRGNIIKNARFWKIIDPPSRDSKILNEKIKKNEKVFLNLKRHANEIEDHNLLESQNEVLSGLNEFLRQTSGNIVFDITCFPKRFFFPIIKILRQKNLKNLIITYSTPTSYCKDELSSNPNSWGHLPLFGPTNFPEKAIDVAIVGVGFMPFGLPQLLLNNYNSTPVKLLFPFPPGPPNYQRTWDFIREIEKTYTLKKSDDIIRIDSNNLPDAYEQINSLSDSGTKTVLFAPYGPKPFSLAMCLFASKHDSVVYYTQPSHYNPNYSVGLSKTLAYGVVLDSNNLY